MSREIPFVAAALVLGLAGACGQPPAKDAPQAAPPAPSQPAAQAAAPAPAKAEHAFRGTVVSLDPAAKTLTVNGENVEGWMGAMTMVYKSDKPEVFDTIKTGDTIAASVFDGDFSVLHDIRVVPAAPK